MKKGDWVVSRGGKVGRLVAITEDIDLVSYSATEDGTFFTSKEYLTVVPKEIADILIAVHNHKEK